MTVAEIKKFVKSEKTRLYNQVEDSTDLMDDLDDYDELLKDILSMLDELEPKSKWEIDGHHRRCEKCGEYFCIDDREGNEIPHNFCGNCGARMNEEIERENKC